MSESNNHSFTLEQLARQQETPTVYEKSKKKYSKMTKSKTFQVDQTNTDSTTSTNESVTMQNLSVN